jgi:hypothetical protein
MSEIRGRLVEIKAVHAADVSDLCSSPWSHLAYVGCVLVSQIHRLLLAAALGGRAPSGLQQAPLPDSDLPHRAGDRHAYPSSRELSSAR